MLKDLYALVRTKTTKVKIDDQCDMLAVGSESMGEEGQGWSLQLSHNAHSGQSADGTNRRASQPT